MNCACFMRRRESETSPTAAVGIADGEAGVVMLDDLLCDDDCDVSSVNCRVIDWDAVTTAH